MLYNMGSELRKVNMMFMKRFTAALLSLLTVISMLAFSSCSSQTDDREGNAYVSVYVYNDNGKQFVKCDAVKVTPSDIHQYEWGKKLTPFLALETACTSKKKGCEIATDTLGQFSVTRVDKFVSGDDEYGNPWVWELYINEKKIDDTKDVIINNYDKIEFKYVEESYRSIDISLSAASGANKLISETDLMIMGEKNELTIKYMLEHEYVDSNDKPLIKNKFGITVDKDSGVVTKIGDVENNDTHKWKVFVNDFEIAEPIDKYLLISGDQVKFEYGKIEEETSAETEAAE